MLLDVFPPEHSLLCDSLLIWGTIKKNSTWIIRTRATKLCPTEDEHRHWWLAYISPQSLISSDVY